MMIVVCRENTKSVWSRYSEHLSRISKTVFQTLKAVLCLFFPILPHCNYLSHRPSFQQFENVTRCATAEGMRVMLHAAFGVDSFKGIIRFQTAEKCWASLRLSSGHQLRIKMYVLCPLCWPKRKCVTTFHRTFHHSTAQHGSSALCWNQVSRADIQHASFET